MKFLYSRKVRSIPNRRTLSEKEVFLKHGKFYPFCPSYGKDVTFNA